MNTDMSVFMPWGLSPNKSIIMRRNPPAVNKSGHPSLANKMIFY